MIHKIEIPKWRPTRDNELVYANRFVALRKKKADASVVACYAKAADVPLAKGKRRVSLEITLTGRQKAADPLAYGKSLLDALVKCGMLVDDNASLCEWGGVRYDRDSETAGTVIVLEDVE